MLQFQNLKKVLTGLSEAKARLSADNSLLVDTKFAPPGPYDAPDSTIAGVTKPSQGIGVQLSLFMLTLMNKPRRILDLGTSVGISAAYLAAAQKCAGVTGSVTTIDASDHRQRIAQKLHKSLGLDNVTYRVGMFNEVLTDELAEFGPFDFALVDGDHAKKSYLALYEQLIAAATPNAVLVFTDITGRNDGVTQAWRAMRNDERSQAVMEQGTLGVIYCFDRAGRDPLTDTVGKSKAK